jgi:hypothetical protein
MREMSKSTIVELSRWERHALRNWGTPKRFYPMVVPDAVEDRVFAGLAKAKSCDDIRALFKSIRESGAE